MKKLIWILVATAIALTFMVGVILAADGKKAPPPKTETTEIDQQLEAALAAIAERTGEQIKWQVIAAGGTEGTSTNYSMCGTAGQTAVGAASSENYGLSHGFWQEYGGGTCCTIRGDINHDGSGPDIADLVYLVTYMFQFGPEPPCMEEADINGDGTGPDIADLVYLVTYMFQFGPAPVPCP